MEMNVAGRGLPPRSDAITVSPSSARTSIAAWQFSAPTVGRAGAAWYIGSTSAPPKSFTSTSCRRAPECVKLLGEVANAEIHVAVAVARLESAERSVLRALGQDAVAQRADAQPRAPERDADAGAENRPQNRGLRARCSSPAAD